MKLKKYTSILHIAVYLPVATVQNETHTEKNWKKNKQRDWTAGQNKGVRHICK